jgi:hypothetical protein
MSTRLPGTTTLGTQPQASLHTSRSSTGSRCHLGDCGIATSNAEKTMVEGAQIGQSDEFMEGQMVAWDNKTAIQQTWAELQTYFTKKWLECKQ